MRSGHGLFDGQEAQAQATTRVRSSHGWHARIRATSWHAHSKVFFLNWDDTQTLLHYKLFPTRKDHVAFMAEQRRATKHLGRMHSHVLTLRSFAREILKPLKGLE